MSLEPRCPKYFSAPSNPRAVLLVSRVVSGNPRTTGWTYANLQLVGKARELRDHRHRKSDDSGQHLYAAAAVFISRSVPCSGGTI